MAIFQLPRETPPSLNGEVFACPKGCESDGDLLAIKSALDVGKACAERALQAARGQHCNQMMTEPARHQAVRDAVHKITKPAFERIDATRDHIDKVIEQLEHSTAAPQGPRDAREEIYAVSVRQALASKAPKERNEAIARAIINGDDKTVAAVLNGPSFLSGIDDVEQARFREDWRRKRMPIECARLDHLKVHREDLVRGGDLLQKFTFKLYGAAVVKAGEESERQANDALRQSGAA